MNLEPGEQTFEVEAPGVPRASVRVVRTVSTTITAPAADTYTNAATLDFAGTATPGVGVDLYRGTTLIEESGADNTGAWSFEDIELGAEGEYSYRVEVGGQSATVRVVVDRTQPAPAVAAPATEPEAATLTFGAAAEPTASFACRLEGPGRGPGVRAVQLAGALRATDGRRVPIHGPRRRRGREHRRLRAAGVHDRGYAAGRRAGDERDTDPHPASRRRPRRRSRTSARAS